MSAGEMFVIFGAALVVGIIAACIEPLLNCKKAADKNVSDASKTIVGEPANVHIKICCPYRLSSSGEIDPNEFEKTKQDGPKEGPITPEEPRTVPVVSSGIRRRVPSGIWSSTLKNQLDNINNSSSERGGSVRVVQARIETRNPSHSASSVAFKSLPTEDNGPRDEKDRKHSSVVGKKLKNLKKILICSTRAEQSILLKDSVPTRRSDNAARSESLRASPEYSAMLQKSQLINVSTSTKISGNASRSRNEEILARPSKKHEAGQTVLEKDHRSVLDPNADDPQEGVSLTERESINGKSICDVRINGLTMNQAQLLDLVEATEGKARSASIVTTEEAAVISITFHRDRSDHDTSRTENASRHGECPLRKLYRTLPEILDDLSIGKLFRSNEGSGKSDRLVSSSRVGDRSRETSGSINKSSYMELPKAAGKLVNDESRRERIGTVSRRFDTNHASRFSEERRI